MNKNSKDPCRIRYWARKKSLAMKLCVLLTFLFSFSVVASTHAQQERINLDLKNVSLRTLFGEIQKQTSLSFVYNTELTSGLGVFSVQAKDEMVTDVLRRVLANTGLTYKFEGDIIVIQKTVVKEDEEKSVTVTGKVTDKRKQSIPGVTVQVKGISLGTVTDVNGRYKLTLPNLKEFTLLFTFVGMKSQEVKYVGKDTIDVVMEENFEELDEVVKVGYYSTTKRRASGSVAVLTQEDLQYRIPTSIDNLFQGMVAGVAVTIPTGRPGASAELRIRGTNSIDGDKEPLWVIDGVPLQDELPEISTDQIKSENFNEIFVNGVAGINPNDIENVTFLKDAAASAIYGSRAAGGVVVITTKDGKPGKTRVNYSARLGIGLQPQRDAGLMNASEKLAWEQELWDEFSSEAFSSGASHYPVVGIVGMLRAGKLGKNGSLWVDDDFEPLTQAEQDVYIQGLSSHTTDWFDEIFRNQFEMTHNLSLSGGGTSSTYYFSLGYTTQEGLLKEDSYERYTMNLRVTAKPSERIKATFGFRSSYLKSDGPAMEVDPFRYAYFANPYERPYNDDGTYCPDMTWFNIASINDGTATPEDEPVNGFNIMRELKETSSEGTKFSVSGQVGLDIQITRFLSFSGLASYSRTANREETILGKESYAAYSDRLAFDVNNRTDRTYGSITRSLSDGEQYSVRGQLSYSGTCLDSHYWNVLFGTEIRSSKNKRTAIKRYGYNEKTDIAIMPENDDPDNYDADWYTDLIDALSSMNRSENTYASFYASGEYSYRERYILNASFRTDGSNNFGSGEQFNPTWSLGLAWNADNESFMQSLKPVLSRLTLRVSTGYTGNVVQGILKNLVITYNSKYWNEQLTGKVGTAPNPKLRWEKTRDIKLALDFGLFDDRISGLVEAYWRKSSDVISRVRVVSSTGYNAQSYNSTEIENKGVEGTLGIKIVNNRDFKWNLTANVAWNRNVLSRYSSPNGTISEGKYVGYPLESIFGGKQIGIDPYDGVYMYQLRPDAVINKASDLKTLVNYRYYLGTSIAPVTGGFTMRFSYRDLSLTVGGSYSLGAKIDNRIDSPVSYENVSYWGEETPQTEYSDLYRNHLNVRKDAVDRWTTENTDAKYPRLVDAFGPKLNLDQYAPTSSSITLGSFLEDVSFLRIRDITLHYNLPSKLLVNTSISSLGISFMMSNFFTITNYSGIDPETPGATYPITRSLAFGINVGF